MKLEGAVVLITGGASGIGGACAQEMRTRGAFVSIADLQPPNALLESDVLFCKGDITDELFREKVLQTTLHHYGRIDVLINNAGVGLYAYAHDSAIDATRRLFDVNVFAPSALAQLIVPLFTRQQTGVIVNIGSIGGEVALPWAAMYCASKFALHCLSESLRRELKGLGIRVVTVKPGVVATRFRENVLEGVPPSRVRSLGGMNPSRLARTIADKIEGHGSIVFEPWYGRFFALIGHLAPWLMDKYLEHYSSKYANVHGTLPTTPYAKTESD